MPSQRKLVVKGGFENLEKVANFVRRSAAAAGLGETQIDDVEMAVDEAVTNSIEHAYDKQTGEIQVVCSLENGEFVVQVRDFGRAFNPSEAPRPRTQAPLSERTVGGLGLFFMRKLMDRVDFVNEGRRGNLVIMTKKIKP